MTEERARRKLSAILSADVKGYSRLMRDDELSTVRTLEAYKEVMTATIKQYRGRVVDSPGDNLLAEFTSVVDAVESAVAIQKELKTKNAELPENRRMEFRIGVNLGDVIEEGKRIYGDGVNIAARIEGLAEGGGISISGTVFEHVKEKLSVGYAYQGEQTVKNIPEPVKVYRVLMEPEAAGKVIGEAKPQPKQWRWAAIGGVVVLIIVTGILAIWNFYFRPDVEPASIEKMSYHLPDEPSIAVLPFDNVSGDPEQEHFSNGLTDQIIYALSQTPRMFVIARNSTYTYKGKPVKVQKVAEDLGVRYVLEGSFQKSGNRVRITAQLIDAITGHHIWSERYDRELKDLFALQDEITLKILTALRVELTEGEQARSWSSYYTRNLEAYQKHVKAVYLTMRVTKQDNEHARQLLNEAIASDPNNAAVYTRLGWTHFWDVRSGWSKNRAESIKQAIELANKTLAMDDSNDYAHMLLGAIYFMKREYNKAITEVERAIALSPNNADAYTALGGMISCTGRWEEGIPLLKKALRLNPFPPAFQYTWLGRSYLMTGHYEEAITEYKRSINISPDFIHAQLGLAAAYSSLGRRTEAEAEAAKVLRLNPKFSLEWLVSILPYKNQDDIDRYIAALRKAGLPDKPPLPLPDKPSIAVLPFTNMSGDPEQEYFSDGITEEIITALSKTPKLFVIARNSTFTYKNKPAKVQQVGRELGVKYVLEGSVRKAGDKVRVTAQLVDAKTGNHLWAERYDRDLKDIFAIQDEITKKIITALQVKLTEGEQAHLWARGANNLEAYLKVLQGREHLLRFNEEDNALARKRLEEAIALDPEYASAYRFLGGVYLMDVWLQTTKSPSESIARAIALEQKSIALDESNEEAHAVLGFLYTMIRQYDKGIAECERAVALGPNNAMAYRNLGMVLRFAGRPEEAIPMYEKAIRLSPFPDSTTLRGLCMSYLYTGRCEQAIEACRKAVHGRPNNLLGHIGLTTTYGMCSRQEEARATAAEVIRIAPKFSLENFSKRLTYKNQADKERFIEALRKAGLK